ncbi:MAG TPA: autotransporter domain-containing protein, partial [Caulobacteraceae bacterium]|nr:autotransporter domain-containing protein [Caulobacteraceae bacterium]
GAAITLNSNNTVSVEGGLNFSNVNNSVGILATPGVIGSINVSGTIINSETFIIGTNSSDGLIFEPFAAGTSRYGIQTQGAFTGGVTSGAITIQSNNSYGVNIGGGLAGGIGVGALTINGAVSMTGDSDYGVYTAGEITGAVNINASVAAQGQYSVAAQTTGKIDGALSVYSTVSSTGYASPTRPSATILNIVQATPSQVEQGGSALVVQGSVLGGIFLGAPPANTASGSTADLDFDGVADGSEGSAVVQTFGAAPAMVVGGTSPITLGQFGTCNGALYGPGNNCFGLIDEGVITGAGVYDGVSATGLDIGAGGGGVAISGGIRIANTGSITANAYQANSTALLMESGASTPLIQNEGIIAASVAAASGAVNATAVQINSGASVSAFTNYGAISAGVTGDSASAYGVVDNSGTISTFKNYGTISTTLATTNPGDTLNGQAVALNLSANTTGVAFTQAVSATGVTPSILGDVRLSQTGPNNVQLLAGSLTGALSLGSGAGSQLNIANGASYVGALTYSGTGIAISVPNGTLQDNSPTTIRGTSLTVGATSALVVAIDPQKLSGAATNTQFNVGTANLANGATIGVNILSAPTVAQTFTVIQASSLTAGTIASPTTPSFLFSLSTQTNTAAGTVNITVQPKTAAQLGLNKAETAAFPAIYASLGKDTGIQSILVNASSSAGFRTPYQMLLPNSSGDVFQVVTSMSKAVARASIGAAGFDGAGGSVGTTEDADNEEDYTGSQGGLWASEYLIGLNQRRADNEAYRAVGLGLVGGVDFDGFGADLSFASANVSKPNDPGDSLVSISRLEAGLYAAPQFGILHTEARVAGGFLKVSERRQFAATPTGGTAISRTANGSWSGYDFSGHLGASAPVDLSDHFFLMPEAHLDVFSVNEGSYAESGGGQGFDFKVKSRNSTQTSVTAGVVAGAHYGSTFVFRPQIEVGWDQVVTGGPGATTAQFAYGGPTFTVPANSATGGAGVVRLQLKGDGEWVHFAVEAGGEFRSDYQNADVRAVFRISY